MVRLFKVDEIRKLDEATILEKGIRSIDLMEQAGSDCTSQLLRILSPDQKVVIIAGTGNNGGDGIVIARLLHHSGYRIKLFITGDPEHGSDDFKQNLKEFRQQFPDVLSDKQPEFTSDIVIIDAIFGTGLTRPAEGIYSDMIRKINESPSEVISIDIPSGMPSDPVSNTLDFKDIIHADVTLTIEFPKITMLLGDHGMNVGKMIVVPIGITDKAKNSQNSDYTLQYGEDIYTSLPRRLTFSHKGTYGHVLVIAGTKGMAGAAYLCANAALRTGAGLVTVYAPEEVTSALQINSPEIICTNELPDLEKFDAIAIGPGMGQHREVGEIERILKQSEVPVVADADAINIMAKNEDLWTDSIWKGKVLTPHPLEFDRLTRVHKTNAERLNTAREFSEKHNCTIVLKGAYSSIHSKGHIWFNSSGNAGMATAGSGDVLTGIIAALLGQNILPPDSAKIGTFIQGNSGDIASKDLGTDGLIASDIIRHIPRSIKDLREEKLLGPNALFNFE